MSKRRGRVGAIAKKELVEFVRDWRTIVAILVIPLLMFPVLFILFPLLLESEAAELQSMEVDIVVQADDLPEGLYHAFNGSSLGITYEPMPQLVNLSSPEEDGAGASGPYGPPAPVGVPPWHPATQSPNATTARLRERAGELGGWVEII